MITIQSIAKIIDKAIKYPKILHLNKLEKNGILVLGSWTYGRNNLIIDIYKGSESRVFFGKFCSIGPNVRIITGGYHPANWVSTYPFRVKFNIHGKFEDGMPYTKGDILIGNDVWIGTNAVIASGVRIGDGAIIAAGALVTTDVLPYSIVGGVPARLISKRFNEESIDELIKIKWWDWDDETIKKRINFLSSNDIFGFIKTFKKNQK